MIRKFNKWLAVNLTKIVGTVWTAYLFAIIGIMGIVGALTNNLQLTLVIGAISGYFLQLVLLPIIMVGQSVQSENSDKRTERTLRHISLDNDRILRKVQKIVDNRKAVK
jgi:hypothetical protein